MKNGTTAYCEFKRGKIARIKDGLVNEFRFEGGGILGGNISDRVFPDIPEIKRISEQYQKFYDYVEEHKIRSLNTSDISKRLITDWALACSKAMSGDSIEEIIINSLVFCREIVTAITTIKSVSVQGIPVIWL